MKKFREKASANYQIRLRPNRDVENAFRAYETSWETERLESEWNRKIYCELIDLGRSEAKSEKISEVPAVSKTQTVINVVADDKADDESDAGEQAVMAAGEKAKWWTKISVESSRPKTLAEISAGSIAQAFKSGQVDHRCLKCQDAVNFGHSIDIDLPILDLLELDNETFWKRVVESKAHNVLKLEKLKRDPQTNWKRVGLELKLTEYIESLEVEDFEAPATLSYLNDLTDRLATFVENLSILKIKPRQRYKRNEFNPNIRVVNFPSNECVHGSFEFLGRLHNLKGLKLTYNPGYLGLKYERRFFQLAVADIENVGKALASLHKLESLEIRKSDLSESIKIGHLLKSMRMMEHLKVLDFSFCCISSEESGEHFNDFLCACQSLKHLELKGNNFNSKFCLGFANGIENFQGKFEFLGLSLNPILGNGLGNIVKSISKKNNVQRLDISHCDNPLHEDSDECVKEIVTLIAHEKRTLDVDMKGNRVVGEEVKESFIKALDKNFTIDKVHCEECGFSSDQMMRINVLLARNKYFKENPVLKKNRFTVEDEKEIETFLKRTKHPLLLKYKRNFVPSDLAKKPLTFVPKTKPKSYTKFASSLRNETADCRL